MTDLLLVLLAAVLIIRYPLQVLAFVLLFVAAEMISIVGEEKEKYDTHAKIETPPMEGARKATDGEWYVPDPNREGKWARVKRHPEFQQMKPE